MMKSMFTNCFSVGVVLAAGTVRALRVEGTADPNDEGVPSALEGIIETYSAPTAGGELYHEGVAGSDACESRVV